MGLRETRTRVNGSGIPVDSGLDSRTERRRRRERRYASRPFNPIGRRVSRPRGPGAESPVGTSQVDATGMSLRAARHDLEAALVRCLQAAHVGVHGGLLGFRARGDLGLAPRVGRVGDVGPGASLAEVLGSPLAQAGRATPQDCRDECRREPSVLHGPSFDEGRHAVNPGPSTRAL